MSILATTSAGLLTGDGQEVSLRFKTRLAGCLYLLIILGGLFAPFAIAPSGMMLGDAAQPTAAKPLTPKILGLALAFGGVGYLSNIFATTLPSGIRSFLFPHILLPAGIAEASLTLWLIFARVNVSKWKQLANRSY